MKLGQALVAGPQAPEVVKPGEAALDHPALAAQPGAVLGLTAGDQRLDTPGPKLAAVLVVVIAAVGEQPLSALSGSADLAANRLEPVDERQ